MEVKITTNKSYAEAFSHGYQMTLLDENMQQLFSPIRCKDYIGDLFWSEHNKMPISVYLFSWKPGTYKLDRKEHTLFIFTDDSSQFLSDINKCIMFLNAYSNALGFKNILTEDATAIVNNKRTFVGRIFRFSPQYGHNKLQLSALLEALRLSVQIPDKLNIKNLDLLSILEKLRDEPLYAADDEIIEDYINGVKYLIEKKDCPTIKEMDFKNRVNDSNYTVHDFGICSWISEKDLEEESSEICL